MNIKQFNKWLLEKIEYLTKRKNIGKEEVHLLTKKKSKFVTFLPSFIKSRLDRDFVFPGDIVAMTETGAELVAQNVRGRSGLELNGFELDNIIGTKALIVYVDENFEKCTLKYEYRDPYGSSYKFYFDISTIDAIEGYSRVAKRFGDKYMKDAKLKIVKENQKWFQVEMKNPISGYKPLILNLKKFWVKHD
jgi:hypothetical protein